MERNNLIIKTSIFGIIANTFLVLIKSVIGFITGSIAIVLDALNNLSDVMSSTITIVGAKLSLKRPDKKHPYGYGRMEYIASTIIALLIISAGGVAIYKSIDTLIYSIKHHNDVSYTKISMVIIGLAIIVKIIIGTIFVKNGKKVKSNSLIGSGVDAYTDAIIALSTFVCAIITYNLNPSISIESILGIIIGLFIIKAGIEILKNSVSQVLGERIDPTLAKEIKELIKGHDQVFGVYDLILNNYGYETLIGSAHIEVDEHSTAHQIHILTKHIEQDIYVKFGAILTLGIYAKENLSGDIKESIKKVISEFSEIIDMHGFFVDEDNLVVSFDLVIDFNCKKPILIVEEVKSQLLALYPNYKFVVVIDADIS